MASTKAKQQENVFSLSYRGALPDILRLIASKIESGEALADHFTTRVSRETFDLSISIDLRGERAL